MTHRLRRRPAHRPRGVRRQRGYLLVAAAALLAALAALAMAVATSTDDVSAALAAHAGHDAAQAVAEAGLAHLEVGIRESACAAPSATGLRMLGDSSYDGLPTVTLDRVSLTSAGTTPTQSRATRARAPQWQLGAAQFVAIAASDDPGAADTAITSLDPMFNSGGQPTLEASPTGRILMRIGLDALPPAAHVLHARLRLQQLTGGAGTSVTAARVQGAWTEGTCAASPCAADGATWAERDVGVPWRLPGGDTAAPAVGSARTGGPGNPVDIAVTDAARRWRRHGGSNEGVAIAAAGAAVAFASREAADPADQPRLLVDYACRCDQPCVTPPAGSGEVLLVLPDAAAIDATAADLETRLRAWGYSVARIDDDADVPTFDTALGTATVAWVTAGISIGALSGKLATTSVGVVYEADAAKSDAGLVTGSVDSVGEHVTIDDSTHPVVADFSVGTQRIFDAPMRLAALSGARAQGDVLASLGGSPALLAVESGQPLKTSGFAAGRRAVLPFGGDGHFNWRAASPATQLLARGALRWAAASACLTAIADTFELRRYDNNDGELPWASDWIEADPTTAGGPNNGQVWIASGQFRFTANPVAGTTIGATRSADLGSATAPRLVWVAATSASVLPTDAFVLEIDDGSGFTEVARLQALAPSTRVRGEADLAAWAGQSVDLRLRIASGFTAAGGEIGFESIRIEDACAGGGSGTAPPGPRPDPPTSCPATLADNFQTRGYAGSTGSRAWADAWDEIGDDDDPTGGDTRVLRVAGTNHGARLRDKDTVLGILRTADLSGHAYAQLSIKYWRKSFDAPGQFMDIEASADGAVWTRLARIAGPATDNELSGPPASGSWQMPHEGASSVQLRFVMPGANDNHEIHVDDVTICLFD